MFSLDVVLVDLLHVVVKMFSWDQRLDLIIFLEIIMLLLVIVLMLVEQPLEIIMFLWVVVLVGGLIAPKLL